eukprot:5139637-Amphidinium_carterae.1
MWLMISVSSPPKAKRTHQKWQRIPAFLTKRHIAKEGFGTTAKAIPLPPRKMLCLPDHEVGKMPMLPRGCP